MAGRPKGIWHPDKVRLRIRTGVLLTRLKKHALGEVEMTATQVKAAEVLLRKTLPDLKAVEHSGQVSHTTMSDAELDRRIAELSRQAGIAAAAGGEGASAEPTTH